MIFVAEKISDKDAGRKGFNKLHKLKGAFMIAVLSFCLVTSAKAKNVVTVEN